MKDNEPLAVYRRHPGSKRGSFLTKQGVEMKFQEAGWQCYAPHLPKNECPFKWTLHSGRIGATVLLFAITQSDTVIQSRLRWMSTKYKDYLRDTPILAAIHAKAYEAINTDSFEAP